MMRRPLTSIGGRWRRVWARGPQTGWVWGWLLVLLLCHAGCRATLPEPAFTARPTPVTTLYTETLQCLGRLFDAYYGHDFRLIIAPEPAPDKTAGSFKTRDEIPTEITMMVITALTKIHPHLIVSKAFLTAPERNSEATVRPNFTFNVTISTYDKQTTSHGAKFNAGTNFPWAGLQGPEGEAEIDRALSDVSIDLVLFDYPSQVAKSYAPATVQMQLVRESRQLDVAVYTHLPLPPRT